MMGRLGSGDLRTVPTRRLKRALLTAALALGGLGCSAIGYHRVAPPEAPGTPPPPAARPVVVIVVDGLRPDVLDTYLRRLRDEEYEPDWPSGLALLARSGFRLGASSRAEAVPPAIGLAGAAQVASGLPTGQTGLPGATFYRRRAAGGLARFDFADPQDASRIYFGAGLTVPGGPDALPLASGLLRGPTLYERLGPGRTSVVVFHPFARGATWLVPSRAGAAITSILHSRVGAAAVPLFDRGTRDAAVDVLTGGPPRDLVTLWFRGVLVQSCFRDDARCDPALARPQVAQRRALREVDAHLERVLQRYLDAHPDRFAATTFLLTSGGGLADRTVDDRPDTERVLDAEALVARLATRAPTAGCAERLPAALAAGDLVVAPNGAAAHVYVRGGPLGQRVRPLRDLGCLTGAVGATLAADGWLDAAVWTPPEAFGLFPRPPEAQIALRPGFEASLPAHRRARLKRKLRLALDAQPPQTAGDVVLFAGERWHFAERGDATPVPYAHQGGVDGPSLAVPFVVASKALTDVAVVALRATPVEVTDLAPTVLALLGDPGLADAGLRPPVVQWRSEALDTLEVLRADRRPLEIKRPTAPALSWTATEDTVTVRLEESTELWPPDVVALRLDATTHRFDPDANRFPEGAPCTFEEVDGRRRWTCTFPVDRSAARATTVGARRAPGTGADDRPDDHAEPVLLGEATPVFDAPPRLVCATREAVTVEVAARDPFGVSEATVMLADGRSGGQAHRVGATSTASFVLGAPTLDAGCADPVDVACGVVLPPRQIAQILRVPFHADLLEHLERASTLLGATRADPGPMRARFAAAAPPGAAAPERAFLLLRVCGASGACVDRPLVSDVDYARALEVGCK